SLITWILTGNVIIILLYFLSVAGWVKGSYISGSIFFTVAFYLTFYQSFKEKKITAKNTAIKYKNKKIAVEEAGLLIAKLEKRVVET
ncbi:MAG: hypothetical protein WKI04_06390, partial [Ferruginibacter sp.]